MWLAVVDDILSSVFLFDDSLYMHVQYQLLLLLCISNRRHMAKLLLYESSLWGRWILSCTSQMYPRHNMRPLILYSCTHEVIEIRYHLSCLIHIYTWDVFEIQDTISMFYLISSACIIRRLYNKEAVPFTLIHHKMCLRYDIKII